MSVALGAILSYLKSPRIGIPIAVVLLLIGTGLMYRAYRISKRDSPKLELAQEAVATPEPQENIIDEIGFGIKVDQMVTRNHGHRDTLAIRAELKDGHKQSEVLRGKCMVCGKPRNQSTKETKKRARG